MINLPDPKEVISKFDSLIATIEQNFNASFSEILKISTELDSVREKIKILKNIPVSKEFLDQFKEKEYKLNQIIINALNSKITNVRRKEK